MSKTNHTSTIKKKHTKEQSPVKKNSKFAQFNSWRLIPITEQSIERLSENLLNWVYENPEALCFEEFLELQCIYVGTYYVWKAKFPLLYETHRQVMMILGKRREKGGLKNELNTAIVKYTMPYYNDKLKEHDIEMAQATKKTPEEIEASARLIVHMEPFPESDLVPLKKQT